MIIDNKYTHVPNEIKDILARCAVDTRFLCHMMFPERFYVDFSPLHDDIFRIIDGGYQKGVVAAPRGIGKTSIVALAKIAQAILFNQKKYVVYVTDSATNAQMQMESLKIELLSNSFIREFFGTVKPERIEGVEEVFSKVAWKANDTIVLPRGDGQQIRGLLYRGRRPDLFVVDDLENKETIMNEDIRKKRKEWFFADLYKATSRVDRDKWQIIYIDTLKHHDSLLQELLDSSEWESVRLQICDEHFTSYAPDFMTDAEIKREMEEYRRLGLLHVFYMEMMNLPVATEIASFQPEYFQHVEKKDVPKNLMKFILVDPAKTIELQADETAIVGAGIDVVNNTLYFLDCEHGHYYPDQMYEKMFQMALSLGTSHLCVEVTSLNEFITYPIRNEISKRGLDMELHELKPRGNESKTSRIGALVPFYRQGHVYHVNTVANDIELQLLSFPRGKKKDIADAFAYLVQILEDGELFFYPSSEAGDFPGGDMDDDDKMDALYLQLENAEHIEPIEDDWQSIY